MYHLLILPFVDLHRLACVVGAHRPSYYLYTSLHTEAVRASPSAYLLTSLCGLSCGHICMRQCAMVHECVYGWPARVRCGPREGI
jgi:hypothetical protein